ncbi:MAG: HlyD family type I secretion periplasmic adaptor subunit [Rhodobacteraceae bacterium]|nr:HlyD family type I secretion periplasmic adaptor subunit [Paracoccaceae bacterium]
MGVKTGLNRGERLFGMASLAALALLLVLFHLVTIGGAVIAQGRVVVQGKPRPVQSLEGGIVSEIRVRDGDMVAAGDIVVRLDPTLVRINQDILRARLAELIVRRARLEAEEQGLDGLSMPALVAGLDRGAARRHLTGQREVFQSRQAVLDSRKAQLRERILQYEAQISGLEAQVGATESQVDFITQEVENLTVLRKQGLVPESRLLELQGRQADLFGRIALHRSDLAQTRNAIRDAELKIVQAEREFHEGVVTELRDVTAKIEENTLELARVQEKLRRLDILAPVGGIVHEMQIWTEGGVVPPQETLLKVVPVSEAMEFEFQIMPDAIDTVHLGQPARVRFPAFDQRTTPELTGTISGISPDSVHDPATGRSFYRVNVALPQPELARLGQADLIPGMPVEAFLETGQRSVLNFLVKPIADQFAHAFREG